MTLKHKRKYQLAASATGSLSGEEATSASAGIHSGPLSWSNWILDMLVFVEGGSLSTGSQ